MSTDSIITEDDVEEMIARMTSESISAIEFIKQYEDHHRADIATSLAGNMLIYSFEKMGCNMKEAAVALAAFGNAVMDIYSDKLEELRNATRQ